MKRILIVLTILIMSFSIVGCNKNSNSNNTISKKEAQKIALKKSSGGEVVKSGVDRDREGDVYEFEIISGDFKYEIHVSAVDGRVVENEKYKRDGLLRRSNRQNPKNTITMEQAQKIALKESDGGEIVKSKVDRDSEGDVFEFEIINGDYEFEIHVSAVDSSIVGSWKDRRSIF